MPRPKNTDKAPKAITSAQSLSAFVKSICDIMRRSNCASALQYVPELTWILFLRILDAQEAREAERAEAERAERDKEREELLNTLLKEKQFAHYKAEYMGVGYPAETAEQLAKLLPDGVTDEYFAATKAALENKEQEIVSKSLNKQPGLSVGTPPTAAQAELEEENLLRKHMGLRLRK